MCFVLCEAQYQLGWKGTCTVVRWTQQVSSFIAPSVQTQSPTHNDYGNQKIKKRSNTQDPWMFLSELSFNLTVLGSYLAHTVQSHTHHMRVKLPESTAGLTKSASALWDGMTGKPWLKCFLCRHTIREGSLLEQHSPVLCLSYVLSNKLSITFSSQWAPGLGIVQHFKKYGYVLSPPRGKTTRSISCSCVHYGVKRSLA